MPYTIEDVKRLVPEAVAVRPIIFPQGETVAFGCEGEGLFAGFGPGKLLLETRHRLKVARDGLRLIELNDVNPNTSEILPINRQRRMAKIARETLAKIEGVTK